MAFDNPLARRCAGLWVRPSFVTSPPQGWDEAPTGMNFFCSSISPCFVLMGSQDRSCISVSTMILPQSHGRRTARITAIRTLHRTIQSVGATGGVYKGQGRSQRELMTRAY
ncbi:hypothetical protein IEQ34_026207 [Dendrobium chrysotoxum]|uniref:Uncharacterized protein n=1 Tax=Dendrobium chrysotoxum TaxID=161865 RepID=A0AAV7FMU6_DENCH|nr:hypothetical protein IEQ34_026207 [Dendrobium chrysotoxum]